MIRTRNQHKETKVAAPDGLTELVRGTDHDLVVKFEPMVRKQDVTLDLHSIGRIDAAGIAALISLYGCAREAGNTFHVTRVNPRVEEILQLVGLDHILVTSDAARPAAPSPVRMECPAA